MPGRPQRWMPVLVFVIVWGLTTHGKFSVAGDDPHYLMVTESLLVDGDWDLENNYQADAGRRFGHDGLEPGAHAQRDRRGALAPVHELGLPLLLLPAYAIAVQVAAWAPPGVLATFRMSRGLFAHSLIALSLLGLSCAGLGYLVASLRQVSPAWGGTVALLSALTPPFLSASFQIYPEVPAWCVSCVALWLTFGPGASRRVSPLCVGALLGILPLFHRKFAALAVGLLFVYGWTQYRTLGAERARKTVRGASVGLFVPVGVLVVFTLWRWGTVVGPLAGDGLPFSGASLLAGIAGIFIDRESGLLVWAPMYALLPAAFWLTRRQTTVSVPAIAAVVLLSAGHLQWWAGFSPAARFLLPVVPWFALALALAARHRSVRWAVALLLVPQILIAAYSWQHPRVLWPQGDGHNRALEALPLGETVASFLPSFRTDAGAWTFAVPWLTGLVVINVFIVLAVTRPRWAGPVK